MSNKMILIVVGVLLAYWFLTKKDLPGVEKASADKPSDNPLFFN